MKNLLIISLTLFSFFHEEIYPIQDYSCENNQIKVAYEDTWYDVSLFNVFLKEDSNVCSYLEGELSMEFDSYTKIENPLNIYLFVDHKLLQQVLIENDEATSKIDNPNYKYNLKEKSEKVLKEVKNNEKIEKQNYQSRNIAIVIILSYIGILFFWIYKCKHR